MTLRGRTLRRALLAAMLLASAGPARSAPAQPAPRSILLITVESLRPDHLGCYAGEGRATPSIDALAARGVRFETAYAASTSTVPSVASLLTGLYPSRHGLRHDLGGRLKDRIPTLGGTLSKAGYRTGAVVGTFHLDSDRGLNAGFALYDDEMKGVRKIVAALSKERRADEVVRKGLEFLDTVPKGTSSFLWLDLYDPHYDYDPPEPLKKQFEKDLYAGEVAHVDAQIGVLVEGLRARGLDGSTIVVLAGSHGEGLGDHQETGHGFYLYDTTLRVPLIVVPAGAGQAPDGAEAASGSPVPARRVVKGPVGLIDVFPTVLDLAGLPLPSGLDGRSLAAYAKGGGAAPADRRHFAEAVAPFEAYGWSPLFAVIEGSRKVVQGQRLEAFDLQSDPGESRSLAVPPDWAGGLVAFGRPLLGSFDLPQEERRRILRKVEALELPWRDSPFCLEKENYPDPRDRIELNDSLFRARIDSDQRVVGRAARIGQEVLETDPTNLTALELVAALAARGGFHEGVVHALEIMQCDYPFRGTAYHFWGHEMEKQGLKEKAVEALEVFALTTPRSEEPYYDLAVALTAVGKKAKALDYLAEAIKYGAEDLAFIRIDSRLKDLRGDPRFADLVGPVEPLPARNP
jgi:arylsulfatase A-like enzyme